MDSATKVVEVLKDHLCPDCQSSITAAGYEQYLANRQFKSQAAQDAGLYGHLCNYS